MFCEDIWLNKAAKHGQKTMHYSISLVFICNYNPLIEPDLVFSPGYTFIQASKDEAKKAKKGVTNILSLL